MKWLGIRQVRQNLKRAIEDAQREGVVIMVHGRPDAVILGVRGKDVDDVYARSTEFWAMVEERIRMSNPIPFEDARKRMEAAWARRKPKRVSRAKRRPMSKAAQRARKASSRAQR